MKWFRQKIRWLWYIIRKFVSNQPIPFQTVFLPELPDNLKSEHIYLIGENKHLWSAALLCPCGCQLVIQLNLLPDAEPCWRVEEHFDGTSFALSFSLE